MQTGLVFGKTEVNSSFQNKRYLMQMLVPFPDLPDTSTVLRAPPSITEPELTKIPRENTISGNQVMHVSLSSF